MEGRARGHRGGEGVGIRDKEEKGEGGGRGRGRSLGGVSGEESGWLRLLGEQVTHRPPFLFRLPTFCVF